MSVSRHYKKNSPRNVRGVKDTESNSILMVCKMEIFFQAEDLDVANVGAVDKRTQEQQRKHRKDSVEKV